MSNRRSVIITSEPVDATSPMHPALELARFLDTVVYTTSSFGGGAKAERVASVAGSYSPSALAGAAAESKASTGVVLGLEAGRAFLPSETNLHLVLVVPPDASMKELARFGFDEVRSRVCHLVLQNPWHHLFALERLQWPVDRLELVPPGIDADFHTPAASAPGGDPVVAIPAFAGLDWASIVSSGLDRDVRLEILMPNNASVAFPNNLPSGVKVTSGDATVIRDGLQRASLAIVPVASKESGDGAASLLAAMACGVPVVASRTWGLEHLMVDDHEGVFTAPSDGAALRAAVRKLLAAPDESRALGNHARAKVVASLSNRHWAARLARVASVLCEKPSSQFYLIAAHGRVGTGGVA